MTLTAMGSILLAPPATSKGWSLNLSTTTIVIIVIIIAIILVAIIGFRAPDRSPGIEEQKERERIDE